MPEIFLTEKRDGTCEHPVFGVRDPDSPVHRMSWENLIYAADFLLASGERRLVLSGGEPDLHPQFPEMAAYLLERGFEVSVSTAGIAGKESLEKSESLLSGYPLQRFHFLLNLDPFLEKGNENGRQEDLERFLQVFGGRCFPTARLTDDRFSLVEPIRMISEFGMSRNLSLGLRHPMFGNDAMAPEPAQVRGIVDRVFSFAPLMERFRIQPILACGWPMCCFNDDHLAWLGRNSGRCDFTCGPTIGIGPEMTIWPCSPLYRFRNRSLFEFNSLSEIHRMYLDLFMRVKVESAGIFIACDTCRYRDLQRCGGGCLVHNLMTFQDEEPLRLPEVYP